MSSIYDANKFFSPLSQLNLLGPTLHPGRVLKVPHNGSWMTFEIDILSTLVPMELATKMSRIVSWDVAVEPKIWGKTMDFTPQIHPNHLFIGFGTIIFHHPFWGFYPLFFGKTHIMI